MPELGWVDGLVAFIGVAIGILLTKGGAWLKAKLASWFTGE